MFFQLVTYMCFIHVFHTGKWAGVISNTRITHATPAAAYAHLADRDWEAVVPDDVEGAEDPDCMDAADQLVNLEGNRNLRVCRFNMER